MNGEWVYSEKVKDHFMRPRNVLYEDESMFRHNGRGMVGNPTCGDQMLVLLYIEGGRIADVRWKTYGCASAIAATSMMSEAVKGMTLEEAAEITPEVVAERLGGLPKNKFHCSVLGDRALKEAIADYHSRMVPEGGAN